MTNSTPASDQATPTSGSADELATAALPGGDDPTPAIDAPETQLRITAVISLLVALFGAGLFAVRAVEQTREAGAEAVARTTLLAAEERAALEAENTDLEGQLADATARIAQLEQAQAETEARAAELEQAKTSAQDRAARLEQAEAAAQDLNEDLELKAQQAALAAENAKLTEQLARTKASLAELEQARAATEQRADELRRELGRELGQALAKARATAAAEANMAQTEARLATANAGLDTGSAARGESESGPTQANALGERWPAYAALGARFTDDGMLVTLGEQALRFEPGSATLTNQEPSALREVNRFLATHPEVRVELRGHTDSTGPAEANRALSEQRAEAVQEVLVSLGTSAERIRIDGRGEQEPIADNQTAAGRRANRRVEILLIADRSDLDG
ncbi:MAG: OmpA family protein [Gammaproteobacteria bacterium]|nr:OmpA family protein [Gammaproteobacteria bacterium]